MAWNIVGIGGLISIAICVCGFFTATHPILKIYLIIVHGIIGLAGLVFMYLAIIASIEAWYARGSKFYMKTMPGVIGGKMSGQLVLPKNLTVDKKVHVHLTNMEDVSYDEFDAQIDGSPPGHVHYLYGHTITIDAHDLKFICGKCLIPVEFTIPYDTKDETDSQSIPDSSGKWDTWYYKYSWHLRVYTDRHRKVNLDISFTVPIFRTKDSDPSIIRPAKSEL